MILKSITLYNYKNFLGENFIELKTNINNSSNIILIGGSNGSGKTTILEAIKICLLGRKFNKYINSDISYKKIIISSKNKKSNKNDTLFYVELELDLASKLFPNYSLKFRREWTLKDKDLNENFLIYRENLPLEIVPKEYWEDYALSIIPTYIIDYFFFDGEKIKELSFGNNAEKILTDAIKDLTGLALHKNLYTDLNNLIKKIRRRNIDNSDVKKVITINEKNILSFKKDIESIDNVIMKNNLTIEKLNLENTTLENNLKREAGLYAIDHCKNQDFLLKLREELNIIEEEIKNICSDILPFITAAEVCKNLITQLEKERKIKELLTSKNVMLSLKSNILNNLDKSDKLKNIDKETISLIKQEINNICNMSINIFDNKSPEYQVLHDLKNDEVNLIKNFIKNVNTNIEKKLRNILNKRVYYQVEIDKVNEKIKKVPDTKLVDDYLSKISLTKTNIEILTQENNNLIMKKGTIEDEINRIEIKIGKLEEEAIIIEKDNIKIELALKIQNLLRDYMISIIDSKIDILEDYISTMYLRLSNKDDMIKSIKIDKDDFTIKLLDFEENFLDKNELSAGEKEIYALSILWGLSKISQSQLPIIIDSPLGKLDSTHRENIITKFLPFAGDQVIILSHDKEITQEDYSKLKFNINKSYTLTLNDKNKIIEGYFPKS